MSYAKQALSILYRGDLSSCNYGCYYCPFAKHQESKEEILRDKQALCRFSAWLAQQHSFALLLFFTPWGEALVRNYYRQAIVELSHLEHIQKIAVQSNISCRFDWLEDADKTRIALWATYHPTEVSRERFLASCEDLLARAVPFSVGTVGIKEHIDEIEALRAALPPKVYLWVNAYDKAKHSQKTYYDQADLDRLNAIDPLFGYNNQRYASRGKSCRTGEKVISVDAQGDIRRCHFVSKVLGNIYTSELEAVLFPRPCSRQFCDCHIGYVHMEDLGLGEVFGEGVLERIPDLNTLPNTYQAPIGGL